MGDKKEGFRTDHLLSKCCLTPIRFQPTSEGYSMEAWCGKCGRYCFVGRTESLIALWMGDMDGVLTNKGFIPSWVDENG